MSFRCISGKRFVLRDELELLKAPPEPASSVAFLSPFDPLVWDRKLLDSLFGFHYVWELFLPPAKRRWGWYVLPILFGDRLVGRLEPRIEREGGRVQILDVWWEEGFRPGRVDGFVEAMRDALRAYLEFAGASRTVYMDQPDFESPADMWMGHSRGHWEGETLVVEVDSQVPDTWLDSAGNFHTEKLRVTERFTAKSPYHLLYEVTLEDPAVYAKPWKMSMPLYRRVDTHAQLLEFKCIEFAEELMYGHLTRKETTP